MESNVYAPPAAVVAEPAIDAPVFYVVSKTKFFLLFLLTFGAYQIVWAYLHWRNHKYASREDVSPVWRAVFQLFFFHSLTRRIDERLKADGRNHAWSPQWLATGAVVLVLANVFETVISRSMAPELQVPLMLALLVPYAIVLWRMQVAANIASGDPAGAGNSRYTLANWAWSVVYGFLWLSTIAGMLFYMAGVPVE